MDAWLEIERMKWLPAEGARSLLVSPLNAVFDVWIEAKEEARTLWEQLHSSGKAEGQWTGLSKIPNDELEMISSDLAHSDRTFTVHTFEKVQEALVEAAKPLYADFVATDGEEQLLRTALRRTEHSLILEGLFQDHRTSSTLVHRMVSSNKSKAVV